MLKNLSESIVTLNKQFLSATFHFLCSCQKARKGIPTVITDRENAFGRDYSVVRIRARGRVDVVAETSIITDICGSIGKPLNAVVRKGKEHYFCRFRFENFYDTIKDNPDRYEKTLRYIKENDMPGRAFDLDTLKIPIGLKSKICVKGTCGGCPYEDECKYQNHLRASNRGADVFFQVS